MIKSTTTRSSASTKKKITPIIANKRFELLLSIIQFVRYGLQYLWLMKSFVQSCKMFKEQKRQSKVDLIAALSDERFQLQRFCCCYRVGFFFSISVWFSSSISILSLICFSWLIFQFSRVLSVFLFKLSRVSTFNKFRFHFLLSKGFLRWRNVNNLNYLLNHKWIYFCDFHFQFFFFKFQLIFVKWLEMTRNRLVARWVYEKYQFSITNHFNITKTFSRDREKKLLMNFWIIIRSHLVSRIIMNLRHDIRVTC